MEGAETERDPKELESIFERHADEVRAYAWRRVGFDDAQDVVAETFLVAWRRMESLPDDPLPWLLGVARKVIGNGRRSLHRRQALTEKFKALVTQSPPIATPDMSDSVEQHDMIIAAMKQLGYQEREALMLSWWEGLANDRAAVAAGCSKRAFATRLHRARRHLAMELTVMQERDQRVERTYEPARRGGEQHGHV